LKEELCKGDSPCHIYLTYPEKAYSSIIVNFQIADAATTGTPMVYYDTISRSGDSLSSYAFNASGNSYTYESVDITRGIHWVQIDGLAANTTYYFRCGLGSTMTSYSGEKSVITIPGNGVINFVAGGDMGVNDITQQISQFAAKFNPSFAMVGGDLAYANDYATCYRVWDLWLNMWETSMITTSGSYIPMILAMGNHESGGTKKLSSEVNFYLPYFVQDDDASTDPSERKTYQAHQLSQETVVFCLDTGLVSSPDGSQLDWLKSKMEKYTDFRNKMALYHFPMYPPSKEDFANHDFAKMRDSWVPVFDKYNLNTAFENHNHIYNRNNLLKGGQLDANGTLYIGDGAWGIESNGMEPAPDTSDTEFYVANVISTNFVLLVQLNEILGYMNISAMNENAEIFDNVMRYL